MPRRSHKCVPSVLKQQILRREFTLLSQLGGVSFFRSILDRYSSNVICMHIFSSKCGLYVYNNTLVQSVICICKIIYLVQSVICMYKIIYLVQSGICMYEIIRQFDVWSVCVK